MSCLINCVLLFFFAIFTFYNLCTTLANSAQQDNDQYHRDTIQVMLLFFFFFFFFDGTFPKSIGRKPGALLVSIASARLAATNFLLSLLLFVTGAWKSHHAFISAKKDTSWFFDAHINKNKNKKQSKMPLVRWKAKKKGISVGRPQFALFGRKLKGTSDIYIYIFQLALKVRKFHWFFTPYFRLNSQRF